MKEALTNWFPDLDDNMDNINMEFACRRIIGPELERHGEIVISTSSNLMHLAP
jgi:hypothetical protein